MSHFCERPIPFTRVFIIYFNPHHTKQLNIVFSHSTRSKESYLDLYRVQADPSDHKLLVHQPCSVSLIQHEHRICSLVLNGHQGKTLTPKRVLHVSFNLSHSLVHVTSLVQVVHTKILHCVHHPIRLLLPNN